MSKYKQYKNKKNVYPHKHCSVCNKLIPEEGNEFGEYCSEECKRIISGKKKGKKKKTIFMVGIYVIMIGVFVIIALLN